MATRAMDSSLSSVTPHRAALGSHKFLFSFVLRSAPPEPPPARVPIARDFASAQKRREFADGGRAFPNVMLHAKWNSIALAMP